tara:strand:+ start:2121 stop:2303 length:183 start_codon:yes stop_codon:yes gene_type:complete
MTAIIKNAQYSKPEDLDEPNVVNCTYDGEELSVPIDIENRHYIEIKKQLDAGTLTIKDAE